MQAIALLHVLRNVLRMSTHRLPHVLRSARHVAAASVLIALGWLLAGGRPGAQAQALPAPALESAAGAFTWRVPVGSARFQGLAGAGAAGLADLGALTTNPAGLGYYTQSEAAGAFGVLQSRSQSAYRLSMNPMASDAQSLVPASLGLTYTFPTVRGALVVAGGYNGLRTFGREVRFGGTTDVSSITTSFLPFDEEYRYAPSTGELTFPAAQPSSDWALIGFEGGAIEFFPADYEDGFYPFEPAALTNTTVDQQGTYVEEGHLGEFNLGGAFEAARGVMVGLSANIVFGRRHRMLYFEEADRGQNADYEVIRGGQVYRGLGGVTFERDFDTEAEGVNLRGGVSAALAPGVRLGLSLETPTYLQVRTRYSAIVQTDFLEGGSLRYGGRPNDVGTGTAEYEIITPWRVGAGLAAGLQEATGGALDLTLYADAAYVDWSQMEVRSDYDRFTVDLADLASTRFGQSYGAVLNWTLGLEYQQGPLAVRGGYGARPDPYDPAAGEDAAARPDRGRTLLSAGLGFQVNDQVSLEAAWLHHRYDDQLQPYPEDFDGLQRQEDVLRIGSEARRNLFTVGLRYAF